MRRPSQRKPARLPYFIPWIPKPSLLDGLIISELSNSTQLLGMPPQPMTSPPPGGDRNEGPGIETTIWIFTSIALLTVISRIFGRVKLTRNLGWDDFWIVIAMLFKLIYASLVEVGVKAGYGRHPYYIGPMHTSEAIHWSSIAFVPGVLAFAVPKLSVTILLTRLLRPRKIQIYIMYFLSFAVIIGGIIAVVILWQQCDPPEGLWNPSIGAHCWSPSVVIDCAIVHGGRVSSPLTYRTC